MKRLGVIERALGVAVMAWALVAGLPNAASAAPQAAEATSVSNSKSTEAEPSAQQFDQRYAERAETNESLQAFEGGDGAGIYLGGGTLVVVLLVILIILVL